RTPSARRALEAAVAEADRHARGSPVGPEHLLLALLRDEDAVAAELLRSIGVPPERVRAAVAGGWPKPSEITAPPATPPAPAPLGRARPGEPADRRAEGRRAARPHHDGAEPDRRRPRGRPARAALAGADDAGALLAPVRVVRLRAADPDRRRGGGPPRAA